ncbi:MAG: hypothetical protein NZ901_07230 [Geminocystis sp.]|nr:hypothetical protein [Geminocystis sp.]HIK36371.1 hypothetical protein [Geminocystis sp. M7585_C2015_104]MCS7147966.1 hypothetical protein [Geminocystis sp.]MCX8078940.1 hypothetical protein [Geminocystis sp.]MDW8116954.1 hypothetical protein [Geminocystis sp.]
MDGSIAVLVESKSLIQWLEKTPRRYKRIPTVDDSANVRKMLAWTLENANYPARQKTGKTL